MPRSLPISRIDNRDMRTRTGTRIRFENRFFDYRLTCLVVSLLVAKTDVQNLLTTLELRENGGRRQSRQRSAGMHSHECTQILVKLRRRHYLGRVDVTFNKFDKPQWRFARLWLGIAFAAWRFDVCETEVVKWHNAGVCRWQYWFQESNRTYYLYFQIQQLVIKLTATWCTGPKCVFKSNIACSHAQKWNTRIACSYSDTAVWRMAPIKR